jgi:hypothetical protein
MKKIEPNNRGRGGETDGKNPTFFVFELSLLRNAQQARKKKSMTK